jgi:hypothetical protein
MLNPIYYFKVNLLKPEVIFANYPDSNLDNIKNQLINSTIWVEGVPYALKHNDVFTLSGMQALKVKELYIDSNQTPILEIVDIPNVENLTIGFTGEQVGLEWSSNNNFYTQIDTRIDEGNWIFAQKIEKGVGAIILAPFTETGNLQVRLKFVDDQGNFSRSYIYQSIEICSGIACVSGSLIESFPFYEQMYPTSLQGALYDDALLQSGQIRLTQDAASHRGFLAYKTLNLPSSFQANFDFKNYKDGAETRADAVYFYFYADDLPTTENGYGRNSEPMTGYIVSFSEYLSEIKIIYVDGTSYDEIGNFSYAFNNDIWYNANILYSGGEFAIYINESYIFSSVDNLSNSRNHVGKVEFGLAARTGLYHAEHYIGNFYIASL